MVDSDKKDESIPITISEKIKNGKERLFVVEYAASLLQILFLSLKASLYLVFCVKDIASK